MPTYTPVDRCQVYEDWKRNEAEDFEPSPRQLVLMSTYRAAKAAGMFYTSDVLAFAIKHLNIPPEIAGVDTGSTKVEGCDLGMDMYYARAAVDAMAKHAANRRAFALLAPAVGMPLGALCVNYKRTTNCVVTAVNGTQIKFSGKRGAQGVSGTASAGQIISAAQGAHEKKWRKEPLTLVGGI